MNDTLEVNIPLLRKVVEWAEAEARIDQAFRAWDQQNYCGIGLRYLTAAERAQGDVGDCGTTYCIAGKVLHDAGWTDAEIRHRHRPDIPAAALLGIPTVDDTDDDDWGDHLFAPSNTIEDVRRIAETLAGQRL